MKIMPTNKIGILGFGCVGQGLYDVLQDNQQLEVARICVRDKNKERKLPASAFTFDAQELLQDESLVILTELISNPEEALVLIRQALEAGKTVVSANKKAVAENLPELIALQQKYGSRLLYEAAVCGSIPILRTLEAYYADEPMQEVSGILNGSSNYILTKLDTEGCSYEEALRQAQELGFAEADPTLDVAGHDALHKICIIAAHAFGVLVDVKEVLRFGIAGITAEDIDLAHKLGARIKLVASAKYNVVQQLEVQVLPTFVWPDNELYYVQHEFNGVVLEAKYAGSQFLKGRGAGSHPTGSAVWADVTAALKGYKYTYPKLKPVKTQLADDTIQIYLRLDGEKCIPNLRWQEVVSFGVSLNKVQLVGKIKRSELMQHQAYLEGCDGFVATLPSGVSLNAFVQKAIQHEQVTA
ncbi:homoserine dehydrogenase [Pontibacter sp. H249]|uniref:homoserine dehydrogenase n=1 Tax=Pontibacter sp. H249 TaxID=3133420 RepID=UPI0030BD672C